MSSVTPIRPKHFKAQVFFRQLRVRVDGNAKVEHGLTQIRGIGQRFAQAIVRVSGINPNMRIGALSEKELNTLEEIVVDPITHGIPSWMVNRKKDLRDGQDIHIVGNKLDITVQKDIARMKRIRSYKGVRHARGLKVRGQRTKSTGRHGLVVGVFRKNLRKKKIE